MPPQLGFALNFAGTGVFEQRSRAEALLTQLGPRHHPERARLSAILAAANVFVDPAAARAAAADAAHAAELAGDDLSRGWSLIAGSVADLSCGSTQERREATREVLEIARRTGTTEFVSTAFFLHLAALAELGEVAELDRALSPVGPLIGQFPQLEGGRHVAWFRCLRATLSGDAKAAEELANTAYRIAVGAGDPDAQSVFVGQIGIIRWMQGRVVELEPVFLQARQSAPHEPVWGAALAWIWLKQGRRSAARALVASLPPVSELPVDRNWLSTACILAEVVAELSEISRVGELYEALLPFASRLVTIGLGVTCWGTVDRALALLAAASGDVPGALVHYRRGIELAGRAEAHAWLAEMQWELAELLRASDRAEAVRLASEATATGRALQLHGIEGMASQVLATLDAPSHRHHHPLHPPGDSVQPRPRISVLGDFAVVAADGSVARWQSRKARQLLKILVARRGAAVSRESLMDILWPDEPPARLANRFSVAATTVRRALDPAGALPRDTYLEHRDGLVRLRTEAIEIDVERFLAEAAAALVPGPPTERRTRLERALALYRGEPLHEDQDLWAAEFRREAHLAFFAVAHALAEAFAAEGNHLARMETYRRILALDEYDQRAHTGVIGALTRLGAHGQAEEARATYLARMESLGVPPDPV